MSKNLKFKRLFCVTVACSLSLLLLLNWLLLLSTSSLFSSNENPAMSTLNLDIDVKIMDEVYGENVGSVEVIHLRSPQQSITTAIDWSADSEESVSESNRVLIWDPFADSSKSNGACFRWDGDLRTQFVEYVAAISDSSHHSGFYQRYQRQRGQQKQQRHSRKVDRKATLKMEQLKMRLKREGIISNLSTDVFSDESLILDAFHSDILRADDWHSTATHSANRNGSAHLIRMPMFSQTCLHSALVRVNNSNTQNTIDSANANQSSNIAEGSGQTQRRYLSVDVAGLYNTGTNALRKLLVSNCMRIAVADFGPESGKVESRKSAKNVLSNLGLESMNVANGKRFVAPIEGTPWGKHVVLSSAQFTDTSNWFPMGPPLKHHLVVVVVRHPLAWIKAVCRDPYDIHFSHPRTSAYCPLHIAETKLSIDYSDLDRQRFDLKKENHKDRLRFPFRSRKKRRQKRISRFNSLVEVWNVFHSLYLDSAFEFGLVFVRLEDLLSATVPLVQTLCVDCLKLADGFERGAVLPPFEIGREKAKRHGKGKGRNDALLWYLDDGFHFQNYQSADLKWIHRNLNHTLLKYFGYQFFV